MTASILPPILAESSEPFTLAASSVYLANPFLWSLLIFGLLLINGFFVATEVALRRIHPSQLEEADSEGKRGADQAVKLTKNTDAYLAACQMGITISNIVLGALGEPFVSSLILPLLSPFGWEELAVRWLAFGLSVLLLSILHTILAEQIPRTIGFRKTVETTISSYGPLRIFYAFVSAPVWLIHLASGFVLKRILRLEPVNSSQANTTADELRLMVEETGRAQEVTETEREILENALELNELCVRDILTPRNEVVVLDVHRTFSENLEIALESKHTRFPLVDGHLDKTLGLIHIKDLIREMQKDDSPNLFAAKRDLIHVAEMLPLDDLLKVFLSNRAHIALVVDEFGGSVGLVMLDDVLDQVVGEIYDEFDDEEEPGFQRIDEERFEVQGWLPLHEFDDAVDDLSLEDPDVSTIGGYVTNVLGRIPESEEVVEIENYQVTVVEADERAVLQLRFERIKSPEEAGDELQATADGEDEQKREATA